MPRLAFAVPVDPRNDASGVSDPEGERRKVGDRWEEAVDDLCMTITFDTRNGGLQVVLALRVDFYTDRDWAAAEAAPTVIAVLPRAPLMGFALEMDGVHACGIYPIGADRADAFAVRERLFGSAERTLVLVGLWRDRIRLLKRGMHLERVFEILADTCAEILPAPQESDYEDALYFFANPPDVLFREAMAIYLESPCA